MLSLELEKLKVRCHQLEKQLETATSRFSFDAIKCDNTLVQHYTGLPTAAHFSTLLAVCDQFPIAYYSKWKVNVLSHADQLLMTLMKLYCNFANIDLGVRFNVSDSTVTNIVHTWVCLLHEVLYEGMYNSTIPKLSANKQSMPACFANFPSCRIVLDCTEIQIAIPARMDDQCTTYSHYKHRNTFKGLVGVAPNGTVTFLSKLYPGSVSDKEIVRHSGVLDHMEPGDMVMADKGVLIQDLMPPGVALNLPPFLVNPQFTPAQAKRTVTIARARIHVERAIQRLKNYAILDFVPAHYRSMASKIFQVCGLLVNLQQPLIKEMVPTLNPDLPTDIASGPNQAKPSTSASSPSSQPSGPSYPSGELSTIEDTHGARVLYFEHDFCQSFIDGRQGSNACTVISSLNILRWLERDQQFPDSLRDVANSFVDCIREGNAAYDSASVGNELLGVYDAIHALDGHGLHPRPNCDFGLRSEDSLSSKLAWCHEQASGASTLGGVLVQNPFSISLLFFPCGNAVLFDSHVHGDHGALIAILPTDWQAASRLISSLVGTIRDAHLCLLSVS